MNSQGKKKKKGTKAKSKMRENTFPTTSPFSGFSGISSISGQSPFSNVSLFSNVTDNKKKNTKKLKSNMPGKVSAASIPLLPLPLIPGEKKSKIMPDMPFSFPSNVESVQYSTSMSVSFTTDDDEDDDDEEETTSASASTKKPNIKAYCKKNLDTPKAQTAKDSLQSEEVPRKDEGMHYALSMEIITPLHIREKGVLSPGFVDLVVIENPLSYWRSVMMDKNVWHKFQIMGAADFEDEQIMRTIMNSAMPAVLVPVMYTKYRRNSFFIAKNCGAAIERLCQNNLIVIEPSRNQQLAVHIQLKFKHENEMKSFVQNVFVKVVKKRFCDTNYSLNLSSFHEDPDFTEIIFCPLSYPNILLNIITMALSLLGCIFELNLADNRLWSIKTLRALKELTHLDLRNNEFKNLSELESLKEFPRLKSVWLTGNPLCDTFVSEWAYIERVRSIIPGLKVLDGIPLAEPGCVHSRQNYMIVENELFTDLVNHFIQHYFNLYDIGSHGNLLGIYHKDAIFSMTTHDLPESSKLTETFKGDTSNEKNGSENELDTEKEESTFPNSRLVSGEQNILSAIRKLPATVHDPHSFAISVPVINETMLLISVSGVFREKSVNSSPDTLLSFSRVFLLKSLDSAEYQILHDMLHVSKATPEQISKSFRYSRPPVSLPTLSKDEAEQVKANRKHVFERLCKITKMKHNIALKYLTDNNWDLKEALSNFVEEFKNDKISPEAFVTVTKSNNT